jgi:hypothetical protein
MDESLFWVVRSNSLFNYQRRLWADTVEKPQISPGDKIIYAVTNSKYLYTGREPWPTISPDRSTAELTY